MVKNITSFLFCYCYKEENGQAHNSHASAKYYIIYRLIKYIIYVIFFLIILYKLQRSVRNVSIFHQQYRGKEDTGKTNVGAGIKKSQVTGGQRDGYRPLFHRSDSEVIRSNVVAAECAFLLSGQRDALHSFQGDTIPRTLNNYCSSYAPYDIKCVLVREYGLSNVRNDFSGAC